MTPEEYVITSASGEYTRKVWLVPGLPDKAHPLCLFLDAEHYLRDMQSLPVLLELRERGIFPPVTFLFVSHVSGEARHFDYTCNDRYAQFIGEDVVRWAREKNGLIQEKDNFIGGLSLSGLAAAHIAFRYPAVFSYALCQSGSFWWLADKAIALPSTKARFWLSVGDQETATGVSHPPTGLFQAVSQIEGVEAAAKRFASLGGTVKYSVYAGGHAGEPWRAELAPALEWLARG